MESEFESRDTPLPPDSRLIHFDIMSTSALKFSGHEHLRTRLALCLLSGKAIRIDRIRPDDKNPGLRGALRPPSIRLTLALNPLRALR